jgi:hypothetical protein
MRDLGRRRWLRGSGQRLLFFEVLCFGYDRGKVANYAPEAKTFVKQRFGRLHQIVLDEPRGDPRLGLRLRVFQATIGEILCAASY